MTDRQIAFLLAIIVVGSVFLGVFAFVAVARAQVAELQPMTITIPFDNKYKGDPGDVFLVATEPLPEGINCTGVLKTDNNKSQHPDTNIIMVSATTATIVDVEVEAYESRSLALRSGVFESNGAVDLFLQIGANGKSSTGFDLVIDCGGTTTTTVPSTTTTGPTTSTTGPSSTTSSSIPTGIPSGLGPVEDGLSPAITWALLAALSLGAFLGWAFVHGGRKIDDG